MRLIREGIPSENVTVARRFRRRVFAVVLPLASTARSSMERAQVARAWSADCSVFRTAVGLVIGPDRGSNWVSIMDVFPRGFDPLREDIRGRGLGIVCWLPPRLP